VCLESCGNFWGDCLKGRMIFVLLIVVNVKCAVLRCVMLIAWSVYPDI
jgi:hypothetical protein